MKTLKLKQCFDDREEVVIYRRCTRKKLNRISRRKERQRLKYAVQDFRELCSEFGDGTEEKQNSVAEG